MTLQDKFGRPVHYLRLSVTDRCNFRCHYCMPSEGMHFLPKNELLSFEEIIRLARLFTDLGVNKIRITGGEPFVRKDLLHLLEKLAENDKIQQLSITTNGVLTAPYLPALKSLGITHINLSLDSINEKNFNKITRGKDFKKVMDVFHQMLSMNFKVKINVVVMEGVNDHEISQLTTLASKYPVSVRFIEEMPFNGGLNTSTSLKWNYQKIINKLKESLPGLRKIESPHNSTSENYTFDGAMGNIGIIAAYSRTFCGNCDRVRITSTGQMRTCLFGHDVLDIKSLLRSGTDDHTLKTLIVQYAGNKAKDGFEAEKLRENHAPGESMSLIGG